MAPNWTSHKAILNITQLIITIIVSALISNVTCLYGNSETIHEFQFISAVVYGYLIVNVIILSTLFMEWDNRVRMLISLLAAILWFCSGSLMLYDSVFCLHGEYYERAIFGAVFSLVNVVAYGVETFVHIVSIVNKK